MNHVIWKLIYLKLTPSSPYLNIQSPPLYQRGDESKSPDSEIFYERVSEYLVFIH